MTKRKSLRSETLIGFNVEFNVFCSQFGGQKR